MNEGTKRLVVALAVFLCGLNSAGKVFAEALSSLDGHSLALNGNIPIVIDRNDHPRIDFPLLERALANWGATEIFFPLGNRSVQRRTNENLLDFELLPWAANSRPGRLSVWISDSIGRPVGRTRIDIAEDGTWCDSLGREAKSKSAYYRNLQAEAIEEIEAYATLAQTPAHTLVGFHEDDFFARRKMGTVIDREFFRQVCRAAREINPQFQFGATIYCRPQDDGDSDADVDPGIFGSFLSGDEKINWGSRDQEIELMAAYLNDDEINSCISEVAIWRQAEESAPGAMNGWNRDDVRELGGCIETARQLLPDQKLRLGVYASGYRSLSTKERLNNLEYAFQLSVKDLLLFNAPIPMAIQAPDEQEKNQIVFDSLSDRAKMRKSRRR